MVIQPATTATSPATNPAASPAPSAASHTALRAQLAQARLYLCTDSRAGRGDFADFVDAAYAGGVDVIQLRDKNLEASAELDALEVLREVAERHGKLFSVNDRADIAALSDAPVLHVGQGDLPLDAVRQLLPHTLVGLSTHSTEQIDAALLAGATTPPSAPAPLDYFCVGPVWATPTKPDRAAVGTSLVRYAASKATASQAAGQALPWFAIGGIDQHTVAEIAEAGAQRIVVVRALTEASNPTAAAAHLLAQLPPLS
ncbi:thiamine phosphate synthase [Psychromicrobium xiongbiense]|uniref:thiamine phosphate synthase n=1 Tax=Psychromicrobium xiongbiense TaxID=3051184 RepID=UPI0025564A99|nr:thiamine phosphate synthase [Psychromicrobium sp. YIM S02556]